MSANKGERETGRDGLETKHELVCVGNKVT